MSNSAFQPSILTVTQASSSGSGQGEVNVVTNPSAATDLTKWTATGFTAARATSGSPLDPVVPTGFVLTPQAIGNTFTSEALTVPTTLRNRKLKLEFYYTQASAAWKVDVLNSSDTRFTLTTDSSGVSAIPASASGGKFVTYFDMDSGSTVKVRFTSTAASGAISVTQVIVGPGIQPQGAVVGEWQSYTPTWAGLPVNNASGRYRRVGANADVEVYANITGAGTGTYTVTIPPNLTTNTTQLADSTNQVLGSVSLNGTTYITGSVYPGASTTVAFTGGTATGAAWNNTNGPTVANNFKISAHFTVPVNEWSGSGTVQLAQNDVEYAASASGGSEAGWDAAAAASDTVYGPNGAIISGALSANRNKVVQFQTPVQATDRLVLEYLTNGKWVESYISNQPFQNTTATGYGGLILPVSGSNTQVTVFFNQYAVGPSGSNWGTTTGAGNWSGSATTGTRWRVRKSSAGAAVGFGIVQPGVSSGLVSASGVPGNTTGNAIASGFVGEVISATTNVATTSGTSQVTSTNNLVLSAGIWRIVYFDSTYRNALPSSNANNGCSARIYNSTDTNTVANISNFHYITNTSGDYEGSYVGSFHIQCVVNISTQKTFVGQLAGVNATGTFTSRGNGGFFAVRVA